MEDEIIPSNKKLKVQEYQHMKTHYINNSMRQSPYWFPDFYRKWRL